MRPLLPYEKFLIRDLGISEAEYAEFLAVQERNRIAYCQNPPEVVNGDPVSIVLAVVGLIFQVIALLLRPQPQQQTQAREQRFAPTFGFNSTQELAKYGDPVTLVYTNIDDNPKGGVRVNTSLVWSNVLSYGNSNYGQFVGVIGAGEIVSIRPELTGIGQAVLTQQPDSRYWVYWKSGAGTDNRLVGGDLVKGSSVDPGFPTGANNLVYAIKAGTAANRTEGFSQAFTPSNANTFGVFGSFGVGNINVVVVNGSPGSADVGITVDNATLNAWNANALFTVGTFISVAINPTSDQSLTDAASSAANIRNAAAQSIDSGSLYLWGSTILEFYDYLSSNVDPVDGTVVARFRVVRAGYPPSCPPATTSNNFWLPTKVISKLEVGRYETLSACDVVDFCLKGRVFRRLNDTRNTTKPKSGIVLRQVYFKVSYRKKSDPTLTRVPAYFVLRRGSDADSYAFLKFVPAVKSTYVFEFEPVADIPSDQTLTGISTFYYINQAASFGDANYQTVTVGSDKFYFVGQVTQSLIFGNYADVGTEYDLISYSSNFGLQLSCESGPELTIGVVNEQQRDTRTTKTLYNSLSMLGVNVFSGKNLQDLRQMSAFVDRGKKLRRLDPTATQAPFYPSVPDGASAYPPDIYLDSLLDAENGLAQLTDIEAIDIPTLVESKRYCIANQIFFDGIFAQRTNWRQFWANNAPLLMHELVRINGKEAIRPALPYDPATGNITRQIDISELYNESNILEGSYKEEFLDFGDNTRDLEATIVYREYIDQSGSTAQPTRNFPVNRTVVVRRTDSDDTDLARQSFDISAFCTTRNQAAMLGKYLCNLRRYQRRGCEFTTLPTQTAIAPGEFIYVQLGQITWDKAATGVVGRGGTLFSPAIDPGFTQLTNLLLYKSGEPVVRLPNTLITNAASDLLRVYEGYLFVLGSSLNTKRCFRVEEVQIDEDGVISVKGLEYPLDTEGLSLIAKLDDADFIIV